jgi:arylsulfatase A
MNHLPVWGIWFFTPQALYSKAKGRAAHPGATGRSRGATGWSILPVLLLLLCCLDANLVRACERPNIVLIISDDQMYTDFGFMGNREVKTPNLDALAARSARYPNGYVPSSVCSPSLASLLTGRYPHQHGIHYNHPPPGNAAFNRMRSAKEYTRVRSRSFYLIRSVATLPRVLAKRAGYRCLQTGKFWEGHYANAGFTEGMTVFKPVPGQTFGGNRTLASGQQVAHGNGDWGLKIGRETMKPLYEFIADCGANPFLIWYAPYLPHEPHDAPRRYRDLYKDTSTIPKHRLPYYASISQFDDTVGQLVRHIEQKGLARRTVFVFVVDNGWEPGERPSKQHPGTYVHTTRSKRSPFEPGLRTPILIRWDGQVKPATHTGLVSSIDLMPTLLDAAGCADVVKDLPGINLLPSARGKAKLPPDRAVFGEIYPGDASSLGHPSRDIAYRWVRQGDLKLITTHRHEGKKPWGGYLLGDALFDVVADPGEAKNLIRDPRYREQGEELRKHLDAWWTPGDDSAVGKPPSGRGG